jgi:hypothetical protein
VQVAVGLRMAGAARSGAAGEVAARSRGIAFASTGRKTAGVMTSTGCGSLAMGLLLLNRLELISIGLEQRCDLKKRGLGLGLLVLV